ncbi:MAG: hypothetical protein GQ525_03405, partial [Draconibacterium sp.]|nr:hypothetical protein [Draconibacterium sp.]
RIAKALGFNISEFTKSDQDVIDLLNTLASKVTTGVEVEEGDIKIIEEIREDGGHLQTMEFICLRITDFKKQMINNLLILLCIMGFCMAQPGKKFFGSMEINLSV